MPGKGTYSFKNRGIIMEIISRNGINAVFLGIQARKLSAPAFLVQTADHHSEFTIEQFNPHYHHLPINDYEEILDRLLENPLWWEIVNNLMTIYRKNPDNMFLVMSQYRIPVGELICWIVLLQKTGMIFDHPLPGVVEESHA